MKRLIWLIALNVFLLGALPARQDDVPYIYYYSGALNGVVIERADGTDSRLIGQGLADDDTLFVQGPGWSPDGRWFAWRSAYWKGIVGRGYVVSADGQNSLGILDRFSCVHSMLWHPTENILLIHGTMTKGNNNACPQDAYPVATYWLIDVDRETTLATFSIDSTPGWQIAPAIYWFREEQYIQFVESALVTRDDASFFLVTMAFDGTVTMEPVTRDEAYTELENRFPDSYTFDDDTLTHFTSWVEALEGTGILPLPNSSSVDVAVSAQWDSSDQWLFVGYSLCSAGCFGVTGRVNIFSPETGLNREISDCGAHPTCVGWLPDRVDLADLPPGQVQSVLPVPETMDYDSGFREYTMGYGWLSETVTHEIVCDIESRKRSYVMNMATGELAFVLPDAASCGTPLQTEPEGVFSTEQVVFALSPDARHYAITGDAEYTALYDAVTGAHIATLNFYGIELAFSEDSQFLITVGRYATATWDIQELETLVDD